MMSNNYSISVIELFSIRMVEDGGLELVFHGGGENFCFSGSS